MMTAIRKSQMKRWFDGFRNTPFLWKELLEGLKMYEPGDLSITDYPKVDPGLHIRLGKLTEQFVLFELERNESVQLLKSNIQIFRDQITIGELDCLIRQSEVNIHLEMVYKFYLYDPFVSKELDRWVGPNRNDSLVLKLNKLKEKQLPLLYHPETQKWLNALGLRSSEFVQRLYFKAQLFVPFDALQSSFRFVSSDCIKGFYVREKDLGLFANNEFYVPAKLDWLVEPHPEVEWIPFQIFRKVISELLASQRSPLCWMKSAEGSIQKFFVVWWE